MFKYCRKIQKWSEDKVWQNWKVWSVETLYKTFMFDRQIYFYTEVVDTFFVSHLTVPANNLKKVDLYRLLILSV